MTGQFLFAQTTYTGQLNLNKKDKFFTLKSATDSLLVTINKKNIDFNKDKDYQLIKLKGENYNLISKGDSIGISVDKKLIKFSTGFTFFVSKKKAHQIVLNDKKGTTVLDAKYKSKGNIAQYTIQIFDKEHEIGLLTYATNYLFIQSQNEINSVQTSMYFIY